MFTKLQTHQCKIVILKLFLTQQVYTMSTSEIIQVALFLRTYSEFMRVEHGYAQYVAHTITSVGKILKSHRIGKR